MPAKFMQNIVSKRGLYDYANMHATGDTFVTRSNCSDVNGSLKN